MINDPLFQSGGHAVYNDHFWRQGRLLITPNVEKWSRDARNHADAEEKRMVFKNFSALDEGRSRECIAVFQKPEDAALAVRSTNAVTWRPVTIAWIETVKEEDLPLQIWSSTWARVQVAYTKAELYRAQLWCPMAPIPGRGIPR